MFRHPVHIYLLLYFNIDVAYRVDHIIIRYGIPHFSQSAGIRKYRFFNIDYFILGIINYFLIL